MEVMKFARNQKNKERLKRKITKRERERERSDIQKLLPKQKLRFLLFLRYTVTHRFTVQINCTIKSTKSFKRLIIMHGRY